MVRQKALIVIIPIAVAAVLGFLVYEKFVKPQRSADAIIGMNTDEQPLSSPAWDELPGGDEQDGWIQEENPKSMEQPMKMEPEAPKDNRPIPTDAELAQAATLLSDNPLVRLALSQEAPLALLVEVIDMLACGESPASHFSFLGAFKPFRASIGNEGYLSATKETDSRFEAAVNAFISIPPKNAAEWYVAAEPRLQDILNELGYTDAPMRQKLTQAITNILQIPDFDFAPELTESHNGIYEFKDNAFNNMNGAQKAIVRLGYANCANIKAYARNIAAELQLFD